MIFRFPGKILPLLWSRYCILGVLFLAGCHEGLAPEPSISQPGGHGIRGVITFEHWPPSDSVRDLRLAVLQNYPVANLVNEVLQGRARFTDRLPYGLDSVAYLLMLAPLPPGRFSLIGVAQQFGPNIQTDWRIVGIYFAHGDTTIPGAVDVPSDSIVPNINVHVDFQHLPSLP